MMGEPKKVDSFQLSLPWTRAQISRLRINKCNSPEEQLSLTIVYGAVWAQKLHENSWPESMGIDEAKAVGGGEQEGGRVGGKG